MKRVGWCLACARHTRIFFAAAAWHQQGGKMRTHACCAHAASSLTRRRLLSGGRDEGRSKEEQVFFVRWFCLHTHASNRWSLGGFGLQPPPPCCCCCKTRAWRGKDGEAAKQNPAMYFISTDIGRSKLRGGLL